MNDSLVRAATTASSLEAEQDNGNIHKTQSKATPNESSSQGTNSVVVLGVNTPRSNEDSLKLKELMVLCITLQSRVLAFEQTQVTQENEIDSLKKRVKKLEKKKRSRTYKLKRLYKVGLTARVESSANYKDLGEDASKQGRISDIDADEGITLVSTHDEQMFDADQDLHELKHTKPKDKPKGIVFHETEESTTTTTTIPKSKLQDKDYRTELVKESSKKAEEKVIEGSSKRAGEELEPENAKKHKIDDDKDTVELKQLVKIIPDEEGVAIDAIPLVVKPPSIIDWKIQKEGKKSYYKIIRADESSKIF
uniref:Uncharacterized protein n=1 Tax=Tanacetum cinerariifolium TaxID=118510 RepID=A0A6L2J5P2_TANCI|nr:hypothetical protein [Tanacetum cinerariifolium]